MGFYLRGMLFCITFTMYLKLIEMKKLVDFNKYFETVKVVVNSIEEFEQLKSENPNSSFGDLSIYPNYREKRKSSKAYQFDINCCKTAIEIVAETEKAYKLQVSHISRHINGRPDERHFKWVAKSLVNIIDGTIFYPKFV